MRFSEVLWDGGNGPSLETVMLGIGNVASFELAFSCKIQAKPSRAVRARASTAHGQSWVSSACWQADRQQLKPCVPTCPLASAGTNVRKGPHSSFCLPVPAREQLCSRAQLLLGLHLPSSNRPAPSCRLRRQASRLITHSPKLVANVPRPRSMTSTTIHHEPLEVLRLPQTQHQLQSIKSGHSKVSSNTPRSGIKRRIISSSSYYMSRSTSTSLSFPKHWACVLIRRRPQRLQSLTIVAHIPSAFRNSAASDKACSMGN